MATTTRRRARTHVSDWTRRTVTPEAVAAWAATIPEMPADLAGIADDDIAYMIRLYATDPTAAERAYEELGEREQRAADRAAARVAAIDALTARGYEYLIAVAEVDGVDPMRLRVQEAIAASGRRAGESDAQALRRQYDEWTRLRVLQAEADTRGHLLNAAGRAAEVDPARLFSGALWLARRWASGDLLDWWERNGRVTFAEFRSMVGA